LMKMVLGPNLFVCSKTLIKSGSPMGLINKNYIHDKKVYWLAIQNSKKI